MINSKIQPLTTKLNQSGPSIKELAVHFHFEPVQADIFLEALTHSSYSNEHGIPSNERLEFLGDSVLSIIVAVFLYRSFPSYPEGQLAKLKAIIVSAPVLASFARQMELDKFILLGEGELKSHGQSKQNILEDLFEAFIGAYFLNFGLKQTTEFVEPLIIKVLPDITARFDEINAKNNLQELTQAQGLFPEYRTIRQDGPPHDCLFTVEVLLQGQVLGTGTGKNQKEAQNKAAVAAIKIFQTK